MGFCITDYFVVMVHESSLCLVLCKYITRWFVFFFFFLCIFYSLFKHAEEVCERIFMEGVGKQAHRCMSGYCSAVLLMLQMLEGVYLRYSMVWVYLIICR